MNNNLQSKGRDLPPAPPHHISLNAFCFAFKMESNTKFFLYSLATVQFCGTEMTKTFFFSSLLLGARGIFFSWIRKLVWLNSQLHVTNGLCHHRQSRRKAQPQTRLREMQSLPDGCLQLGHSPSQWLWEDKTVFLHWPQSLKSLDHGGLKLHFVIIPLLSSVLITSSYSKRRKTQKPDREVNSTQ